MLELEEKKLFGDLAFMIRGKMVLTVSSRKDELVMVRIGKEIEKQVLPRTGAHTTLMRGRLYHGYIDLDIEGQKELPYLIIREGQINPVRKFFLTFDI